MLDVGISCDVRCCGFRIELHILSYFLCASRETRGTLITHAVLFILHGKGF